MAAMSDSLVEVWKRVEPLEAADLNGVMPAD